MGSVGVSRGSRCYLSCPESSPAIILPSRNNRSFLLSGTKCTRLLQARCCQPGFWQPRGESRGVEARSTIIS